MNYQRLKMSLTYAKLLAVLCLLTLISTVPSYAQPIRSIKPLDDTRVQAVKIGLQHDPELAPCNIQVTAENNLVILRGEVPNEAAKKRAEKIAKQVRGVTKVANHLRVVP